MLLNSLLDDSKVDSNISEMTCGGCTGGGYTTEGFILSEMRTDHGQMFDETTLPEEMLFTDNNRMSVIAYSILCLIATVGNLTVFTTLWFYHRCRTRVNVFIMHLSVADLIVALVMMPLEIGWNLTVSWKAGDFGCRIFMFFRAFGIYLSSFILIAISLDRYFAVARPLNLQTANRRGRTMLIVAWVMSVIASLPQVT